MESKLNLKLYKAKTQIDGSIDTAYIKLYLKTIISVQF